MKGVDMKEVFEKIINKINERIEYHEKRRKVLMDAGLHEEADKITDRILELDFAKRAVEQEAAEYNNGWIPVEEELPKTDEYILLSFSNFSIPLVGRYEEDENGGAFYVGDETEPCVKQDIFVNAWTNLPAPYQPKGE